MNSGGGGKMVLTDFIDDIFVLPVSILGKSEACLPQLESGEVQSLQGFFQLRPSS